MVADVVIGAIDLVDKPGGFIADDLRIVGHLADQAAVAIQNAQLHEHIEQLAAVAERQRLAHDLHDSVAQSLYSLTLYAGHRPAALAAGADAFLLKGCPIAELSRVIRQPRTKTEANRCPGG